MNRSGLSAQLAQVANLLFRPLPVGGAQRTTRPPRKPNCRRLAALRYGRFGNLRYGGSSRAPSQTWSEGRVKRAASVPREVFRARIPPFIAREACHPVWIQAK